MEKEREREKIRMSDEETDGRGKREAHSPGMCTILQLQFSTM